MARLAGGVRTMGYPFIFKASAGGGGRGMRLVRGPQGTEAAMRAAAAEAQAASGDDTCIWRSMSNARATSKSRCWLECTGNIIHLGEQIFPRSVAIRN